MPYFITEDYKIVRMHVKGDIPYLLPGNELCQPIEPNKEYQLLPEIGESSGVCQGKEVASMAIQTDICMASPVEFEDSAMARSSSLHIAVPGPDDEEEEGDDEEEEWGEEKQMQIVPPPKPHVNAKMRRLAKTVPHILIHKPMNPFCEICKQAKLREPPHRKGGAAKVIEGAKEFGDQTTGDFLASKGESHERNRRIS